jgi:hypothetical protein
MARSQICPLTLHIHINVAFEITFALKSRTFHDLMGHYDSLTVFKDQTEFSSFELVQLQNL